MIHTRLLLAAGMVSMVIATGSNTLAEKAKLPEPGIPQSVGVQLKPAYTTPELLDTLKDSGFRYVRHGFYVHGAMLGPGKFDWTKPDAIVKECKERGLSLMGCIFYDNQKFGNVRTPEGIAAYAEFAGALAERYKGQGIIWEIWNEPNTMTFWGKHGKVGNSEQYAKEYIALLTPAVKAMKKADPDCFILGGSVSNFWSKSYEWTEFAFKHGILKTGIDCWSVHPYGMKTPEDTIEGYDITRDLMKKYGGPMLPLVNSERGYKLGTGEGEIGGEESKRHEIQAWLFVRQQLVDLLVDSRITIWYEAMGKEGFRLLDGDKKEKAMIAGEVMVDQLNGYALDKRLDLGNDRDFALQFKNKYGGVKIVAWVARPRNRPLTKQSPANSPSPSARRMANWSPRTFTVKQVKLKAAPGRFH